jgi:hypothetical protein
MYMYLNCDIWCAMCDVRSDDWLWTVCIPWWMIDENDYENEVFGTAYGILRAFGAYAMCCCSLGAAYDHSAELWCVHGAGEIAHVCDEILSVCMEYVRLPCIWPYVWSMWDRSSICFPWYDEMYWLRIMLEWFEIVVYILIYCDYIAFCPTDECSDSLFLTELLAHIFPCLLLCSHSRCGERRV